MNAIRFDALTHVLTASASRRRTLGGLLGGALVALGLTNADDAAAAKTGRCKQECGECEFCQTGTCKKRNGKKRCKRGVCKPKANSTSCSVGGVCYNGNCQPT